jgi:NAD(P)-dependent dehydrogenase (short-subunit alcohol dehydrogenase family)
MNGSGKTMLVTGATDGIGLATAVALGAAGARVIVHGRTLDKARRAQDHVARATGARVVAVFGDLASLGEVVALAEQVLAEAPALHALVHNAGVFAKERVLSNDGIELTFAVNHLAPFLLTHRVLPALRAAGRARHIVVSSVAHCRAQPRWDDIELEKGYSGYAAYAQSKLFNVMFAFAMARRLSRDGITSNALHPGVITSKLLREGFGVDGDTPDNGARTSVKLALDPALERTTGTYFSDERAARHSPLADDVSLQEKLYALSAQYTKASPLPA